MKIFSVFFWRESSSKKRNEIFVTKAYTIRLYYLFREREREREQQFCGVLYSEGRGRGRRGRSKIFPFFFLRRESSSRNEILVTKTYTIRCCFRL